jgi:hypothetical protein
VYEEIASLFNTAVSAHADSAPNEEDPDAQDAPAFSDAEDIEAGDGGDAQEQPEMLVERLLGSSEGLILRLVKRIEARLRSITEEEMDSVLGESVAKRDVK